MSHDVDIHHARAYFPRGLAQPAGGFRFAMDALLLAAFAVRRPLPAGCTMLDLGCGCGVVALACLLATPDLTATGVDVLPDQVASAKENAAMLGLADRFSARVVDLAVVTERHSLGVGSHALVVANMPYRASGTGRPCRDAARQKALFAEPLTMPAFLAAAKQALTPGGGAALVYPWDTRDILLRALEQNGFFPQELLAVNTGNTKHSRCLIRAVHTSEASGAALRVLPPLDLHRKQDGRFTEDALDFCPWLSRES